MYTRPRLILAVTFVGAVMAAPGLTDSWAATEKVRDLPKSTPGNPAVVQLAPGTTYGASLLDPTPNLTPAIRGWAGPSSTATGRQGPLRERDTLLERRTTRSRHHFRPSDDDVPGGHVGPTSLPTLQLRPLRPADSRATLDGRRPASSLLRRHRAATRRVDDRRRQSPRASDRARQLVPHGGANRARQDSRDRHPRTRHGLQKFLPLAFGWWRPFGSQPDSPAMARRHSRMLAQPRERRSLE